MTIRDLRTWGRWTLCLGLFPGLAISVGCGGTDGGGSTTTGTEDSSSSGAVASSVGGALSGSGTSGTLASLFPSSKSQGLFHDWVALLNPLSEAWAATSCPTFATASGSGCTASGKTMWLEYSSCKFGSSKATWTGFQALTMSSGSAVCGTFPDPGVSGSLTRQFVGSLLTVTPSTATVKTSFGTTVTIDHSTANLGNFEGNTITPLTTTTGGYGVKVNFNSSGARSSMTIAQRITATRLDQSVTGVLTITETAGGTTRSVSGSLDVYHNTLKVIGTSTFTDVVHADTCCQPLSGSISTTFAEGSVSPTTAGSAFVGKTETLTFTACGTATLVDVTGASTEVTLSRCF